MHYSDSTLADPEIVRPGSRDTDSRDLSFSRLEALPFRGRSPRMLFAIHVARDPQTAVYKNTRDRAVYLENEGCECSIVTPEDFLWLRWFGGRFTPILHPLRACHLVTAPRKAVRSGYVP